jgi:hypothetical protein
MKVLFLNSKKQRCGVYQYGKRLFDILNKSININYIYKELDSYDEYLTIISNDNYNTILYNYHPGVMGWLNEDNIQKNVKNIGTQHDLEENNIFDITLRLDTTLEERPNRYNIPRPIFENIEMLLENHVISSNNIYDFINYKDENVPIFGSFGFGFNRKGFDKIVKIINDNYDVAIIKLIISNAETQSSDSGVVERCISNITKPDIKLLITHEFFDEKDLLSFLSSNTMNIFMYESHPCAGVSSVLDYALSVQTPIAISDASWFRHIYSDEICVYKRNIKDILNVSKEYCKLFLDIFSNERLRNKIESIIN